jgi:two-component system, cell cycle sensor histidine kinase and response regulator CckA
MWINPKEGTRHTRKIVAIYILFGSAWIYLSDTVLARVIQDPVTLSRIEFSKGLLFIIVTSALLYHFIGSFARSNAETIQRLAQSEARFQTIFDNVNDAVIIHDCASGRILDVNRTMCNMFGYEHAEALGLQAQDISLGAPPYSQEEAASHLHLAAQGIPQIFQWQSKRKDETLFWSEINMRSAVINGEHCVVVTVRDISKRKDAEEALRQHEETLKVLMEEMPAGVAWTDVGGTIEYLNGSIIDWFGYTLEDVGNVDEWLRRGFPDPEYRATIRKSWSKAIHDARRSPAPTPPVEGRVTCKDGSLRHVLLNIRLVHNRIVYIFTDITKRESMQGELLKAQKLESLGILAGGIAHDFNNILTGILGNLSFATLLLDSSHPARKPVAHAEKASLRAAELAHQLLTFAKGGQPVKKAVSVRNLVDECVSLIVPGSQVATVVDVPVCLQAIAADEGQINQAFNNVIINAVQAMPEGGVLTVKAENAHLAAGNSASLPEGNYVRITFSDEGCGICHEEQQRIFDPYFTTKAGGTGLGLASVHSIVRKHNGKIEVESAVGKGTSFTFYLPSAAEEATEAEKPAEASAAAAASKGSVLVMDDEETIRTLTTSFLDYLGYSVTSCGSGDEAVRLYREAAEAGAPFCAAIMDLTVPAGMGGKEAAKEILATHPGAKLIVSSGYSNDPVMSQYADYGFRAAIVKPYRCAEIQQALSALGEL